MEIEYNVVSGVEVKAGSGYCGFRPMKIYIAGPMTGYENCNRAAFHDASLSLSQEGHTTLNPALLPDGLSQPEYMDICFAMVRAADAVVFLSGWTESAGAQAEYHYAKKLGIKLICA